VVLFHEMMQKLEHVLFAEASRMPESVEADEANNPSEQHTRRYRRHP
jgi:hypothetical protein